MPPKKKSTAGRSKSIGTPKQARLTDSFRHTKKSPSVGSPAQKEASSGKESVEDITTVSSAELPIDHVDLLPKVKQAEKEKESAITEEKVEVEEPAERLDYNDPAYSTFLDKLLENEIAEPSMLSFF